MNRTFSLTALVWTLAAAYALLGDNVHAARRPVTPQASGYESIASLGGRYGFPPPSVGIKSITLKSKYTTMVFSQNSRKLQLNGMLIWLNGPVVKNGGKWSITKADAEKTIDPLLRSANAPASRGSFTVVLDPGHGGNDTGAVGRRKVYEKKVVLDISKRIRKKLTASGVVVKLTREDDSFLSLSARPAIAKRLGADVFVSIHVNSAHNSSASGIETFVLPLAGFPSTAGNNNSRAYPGNKHDEANTLLGYYVQKQLLERTESTDRGVGRARFDVLRDAPCPSILVECGFVSNKREEEKMLTAEYRDNMAEGIAKGILAYIRQVAPAK
jgi:N-acetylmuramoyl-L-alanine amidase